MSKPKYYFERSDSEMCYTKEYFQDLMADEGVEEIKVFHAIPDLFGGGIFWCKSQSFCGDDTTDTCGKQCEDYDPKNGKSGCCKHHTSWLYIHGDEVTLKIKQLARL